MRALTHKQKTILRAMRDKHGWYWGCGWMWDNRSGTIAILDGLVSRGLAEVQPADVRVAPYEPRYTLTPAGLTLADELHPPRVLKRTCDANARQGTGFGMCDRPLDQHGQCDRASDHV